MVLEEVLREMGVPYTRPEQLGVDYHVKRPDFLLWVAGLGWMGLELKNRKPDSLQGTKEALRDFVKKSSFPIAYWGSFNLTEPAREEVLRRSPRGSIIPRPLGFKYEIHPVRFKEKFRNFLKGLNLLGRMVVDALKGRFAKQRIGRLDSSTLTSTVGRLTNTTSSLLSDLVIRSLDGKSFLCPTSRRSLGLLRTHLPRGSAVRHVTTALMDIRSKFNRPRVRGDNLD